MNTENAEIGPTVAKVLAMLKEIHCQRFMENKFFQLSFLLFQTFVSPPMAVWLRTRVCDASCTLQKFALFDSVQINVFVYRQSVELAAVLAELNEFLNAGLGQVRT